MSHRGFYRGVRAALMTPSSAGARSLDDDTDEDSMFNDSEDDDGGSPPNDKDHDKERDGGDSSGDDSDSEDDSEDDNNARDNPTTPRIAQKLTKNIVWQRIISDADLGKLLETLQTTEWDLHQAERDLQKVEQDLQKMEERELQKGKPNNQKKEKKLADRKAEKLSRKEEVQTRLHTNRDLLTSNKSLLRSKEDEHRPRIKECIESGNPNGEPFSHFVLFHATSISLRMALFVLKLILDVAPDQIASSFGGTPLLHKAIEVERDNRNKQAEQDFTGLTSEICKLARELGHPSQASDAIAGINKNNENCLHLVIQHDIYDSQSIIASVEPGSNPAVFTRKRKSADPGENENTPLHDALDFQRVAKRTIPCEEQRLKLCDECKSATEDNNRLQDPKLYYETIIGPLVKGCPDVLKQQNAIGLSPYTYHWETRTRSIDALKNKSHLSEGDQANLPVQEPANWKVINPQPQLGHKKAKGSSCQHQMSYDLQFSDQIVAHLEEWIDKLKWGYEDLIDCLFSGDQDKRPKPQDKQHKSRSRILNLPQPLGPFTKKSHGFLEFESRLALVSLRLRPESHSYKGGQSDDEREQKAEDDASYIIGIFEWLKEKGVTKILKVEVDDNPDRYCSEETIESCLECMEEIMFLDWNRPDLSVPTISKANRLIELCLYSTGTNAVLHHWSDQNGLIQLPKLRKVHLKADKATSIQAKEWRHKPDNHNNLAVTVPGTWGLERSERNKVNIQGFQDRLASHQRGIEVVIDMVGMGDPSSTPSGKDRSKGLPAEQPKHPGYQAALDFAGGLLGLPRTTKKIKVALLDDGVDPAQHDIFENLASEGFPRSPLHGKDDPWYTSTNGHGTAMASIITSICPFVEIHVAKIDCRNQVYYQNPIFDVRKIPDAVEWALNNEIDIMSMSWIFKNTGEVQAHAAKLKKLIDKDERSTSAVIYCAARDNDNDADGTKYYPADCDRSQSIGAANTYNRPQPYVVPKSTKFILPSQDVISNPIDGEADGGNSVATAVAAGVAALVLHCFREDNLELEPTQRHSFMESLFRKLTEPNTNTNYVNLVELFSRSDSETATPRRLVERVLAKLGLERSEVESGRWTQRTLR